MVAPAQAALPGVHLRDPTMDALRGLSLLGVIAIHVASRIPTADPWYPVGRFVDHLGRFGVPLFLGVLGWGVGRAAGERPIGPTWIRDRLRAVGPAYLAWACLYAAVASWDGGGISLWDGRLSWTARLSLTVFGYGAEHLYYTTAYFGLVLLAPLAGTGLATAGRRTALAVAVAGLSANAALLAHLEAAVQSAAAPTGLAALLLHTEARTPLHWFGFFVAGAAMGRWLAAGGRWPAPRLWWLPVGLAAHAWVALRPPSRQFDDFWCSPALVAGSLAALLWGPALVRHGLPKAAVGWLGRFGADSLPTYLGHVLWLRVGWWAAQGWPTGGRIAVALAAVVAGNWAYGRIHPRIFGAARPTSAARLTTP
ncbi:MAG: acyltransferase [Deltaproteobacteria bacterium]|nr:acyltransferase [Deltaproteobacteria bacterium]